MDTSSVSVEQFCKQLTAPRISVLHKSTYLFYLLRLHFWKHCHKKRYSTFHYIILLLLVHFLWGKMYKKREKRQIEYERISSNVTFFMSRLWTKVTIGWCAQWMIALSQSGVVMCRSSWFQASFHTVELKDLDTHTIDHKDKPENIDPFFLWFEWLVVYFFVPRKTPFFEATKMWKPSI